MNFNFSCIFFLHMYKEWSLCLWQYIKYIFKSLWLFWYIAGISKQLVGWLNIFIVTGFNSSDIWNNSTQLLMKECCWTVYQQSGPSVLSMWQYVYLSLVYVCYKNGTSSNSSSFKPPMYIFSYNSMQCLMCHTSVIL